MSAEYHRPPIKLALMGLGRSLFFEHYPVFREHPSLFKVVAACDLVKERRDKIEADYPDCKMFRQFRDMLDEPDIDLVVISTASTDHVEHAMASLERGFWTLVEAPLALTPDETLILRGAAQKAKNRLLVIQRGFFAPDFVLTRSMMGDPRLGDIYQIKIRQEDYVRRDDWQTVKRLGGGAAYYAMTDLILQALKLLPSPPVQMWSELKRVASLGDAEDFAHVCLKTRSHVSAEIEFNGGVLPDNRAPSFELRAERGVFRVNQGESTGELVVIDPEFKFSRRRSSVRTPDLADMHEDIPVVRIPVSMPRGIASGTSEMWKSIYETVRTAAPFPLTIEDSMEAVKFAHLMKKTSPFGK